MVTFQNNKKRLVFTQNQTNFCAWQSFQRHLGVLPYLRWSSLQQLVTMGLTTNGQYLHVTAVTQLSLLAKLKSI